MQTDICGPLEHKFARFDQGLQITDGFVVSGYASVFGVMDQGGDTVLPGAYGISLQTRKRTNQPVKMLWQHDPAQPIGVWQDIKEDSKGLWVTGRLLQDVAKGREAIALVEAGAIDGLSIGYRVLKSQKDANAKRQLIELDLWEVSLVTFPMLPTARIDAKTEQNQAWMRNLAQNFRNVTQTLIAKPA